MFFVCLFLLLLLDFLTAQPSFQAHIDIFLKAVLLFQVTGRKFSVRKMALDALKLFFSNDDSLNDVWKHLVVTCSLTGLFSSKTIPMFSHK